ncbi:MAG TPA: hypothetical protein VG496_03390 [Myxococcales bacterium]|nr:hypothetical protein [Myxococcales bacterium]
MMSRLLDHPILVFLTSVVALWLAAHAGAWVRRRMRQAPNALEKEYLGLVLTASLTLLALVIGFTFSMAVSRYDLRKSREEAEANAIGTEYLRADLLTPTDAARVRALLKRYLEQRILFYQTSDANRLARIDASTAQLQEDLWLAVRSPAAANPTALTTLVVSGMNELLDARGHTQAAWWNRIPRAAWALMVLIAICSNSLVGYTAQGAGAKPPRFFYLPLIVALSFLLMSDIDSPAGGLIRVIPQDLISVSESVR